MHAQLEGICHLQLHLPRGFESLASLRHGVVAALVSEGAPVFPRPGEQCPSAVTLGEASMGMPHLLHDLSQAAPLCVLHFPLLPYPLVMYLG